MCMYIYIDITTTETCIAPYPMCSFSILHIPCTNLYCPVRIVLLVYIYIAAGFMKQVKILELLLVQLRIEWTKMRLCL